MRSWAYIFLVMVLVGCGSPWDLLKKNNDTASQTPTQGGTARIVISNDAGIIADVAQPENALDGAGIHIEVTRNGKAVDLGTEPPGESWPALAWDRIVAEVQIRGGTSPLAFLQVESTFAGIGIYVLMGACISVLGIVLAIAGIWGPLSGFLVDARLGVYVFLSGLLMSLAGQLLKEYAPFVGILVVLAFVAWWNKRHFLHKEPPEKTN